jgi:hypothetical protein
MIRLRVLAMALLFNVFLTHPALSQNKAVAISAAADDVAQITLANGEKVRIPQERGQVGISAALVAPDGAAGWLVEYRTEAVSYPIAETLIIWRAGKIIRRFPAVQAFYSWTFYAQGTQVAFHVGPLHGETKSHCELHDSANGRLLAAWDGDLESASDRPPWTKGLNH